MRGISQLAVLSAAVVVSLVASVAQGYNLLSGSSSTAAVDLLRQRRGHQRHHHSSSAELAARGLHHSERGWFVGGGTGLARRGWARGAVFKRDLRMMMAESGAPPAKEGKGKGPYKVIANNK